MGNICVWCIDNIEFVVCYLYSGRSRCLLKLNVYQLKVEFSNVENFWQLSLPNQRGDNTHFCITGWLGMTGVAVIIGSETKLFKFFLRTAPDTHAQ